MPERNSCDDGCVLLFHREVHGAQRVLISEIAEPDSGRLDLLIDLQDAILEICELLDSAAFALETGKRIASLFERSTFCVQLAILVSLIRFIHLERGGLADIAQLGDHRIESLGWHTEHEINATIALEATSLFELNDRLILAANAA